MALNLARVIITVTAFVIIGLVIIIILQNRAIETFSMIVDRNTTLTGTVTKTIPDISARKCGDECANTPSCIAANVGSGNKGCWLKSTIGQKITDPYMASLRFPCELYDKKDFKGKGVGLDVGKYTLADLKKKGYIDKSLSSFKMRDGYKITLYDKDAFGGLSAEFKTSQPDLHVVIRDKKGHQNLRWIDAVSSVEIKKMY